MLCTALMRLAHHAVFFPLRYNHFLRFTLSHKTTYIIKIIRSEPNGTYLSLKGCNDRLSREGGKILPHNEIN